MRFVPHPRSVTTSKYPQGTGFDTLEELEASYDVFIIPDNEFEFMEDSGLNDKFSDICDGDFSDCEGGEVTRDLLQTCFDLVKLHSEKLPTICAAFEKAIEYGTYLDFEY
ncbi:MAG: hypothetical protein ACI4XA_06270 [Oscillospiraceae bacterium]